MLKFKDGATLNDMEPIMLECVDICNTIYDRQGADCTVTSTDGLVIGLRIWHISDVEALAKNLRRALGIVFDVVIDEKHLLVEHKTKAKGKKK